MFIFAFPLTLIYQYATYTVNDLNKQFYRFSINTILSRVKKIFFFTSHLNFKINYRIEYLKRCAIVNDVMLIRSIVATLLNAKRFAVSGFAGKKI